MTNPDLLTFATQGPRPSYHYEAARLIAGAEVNVISFMEFGDVVDAAMKTEPGLGVVAYRTVAGTVDKSVRTFMRQRRTSTLPQIVARQDVPISLSLIGAREQSLEDLDRQGVRLLGQDAALKQVQPWLAEHLPQIELEDGGESIEAVRRVIEEADDDLVALGPTHAASPLGGFILGPNQINPAGSITSFFVLQRDPEVQILPVDPEKSQKVTVLSLLHPEGPGEMEKIINVAHELEITGTRFNQHDPDVVTKHNPDVARNGGLLEIRHGFYDEKVTTFCKIVNNLKGNDRVRGAFDARRLGRYDWYPEDVIDLRAELLSTD